MVENRITVSGLRPDDGLSPVVPALTCSPQRLKSVCRARYSVAGYVFGIKKTKNIRKTDTKSKE